MKKGEVAPRHEILTVMKPYYEVFLHYDKCNPDTERKLEISFGDDMLRLGFLMDSGHSLAEKGYPARAFHDMHVLNQVIGQITDIARLTSLLISKWRYITHWASIGSYQATMWEHRNFFLVVLKQLISVVETRNESH